MKKLFDSYFILAVWKYPTVGFPIFKNQGEPITRYFGIQLHVFIALLSPSAEKRGLISVAPKREP